MAAVGDLSHADELAAMGAAPPAEPDCADCNDTGTRWRDGTAYECECPGNQPAGGLTDEELVDFSNEPPTAPRVEAPPAEGDPLAEREQ